MVADITSLAAVEQKEDLVTVGLCALSQVPHIHETLAESTQKASLGPLSTQIQEGLSTQANFAGAQTTPGESAFNQLAHFWGLSAVATPTFMPDLIVRLHHICHSATDMWLAHLAGQSKLQGST